MTERAYSPRRTYMSHPKDGREREKINSCVRMINSLVPTIPINRLAAATKKIFNIQMSNSTIEKILSGEL